MALGGRVDGALEKYIGLVHLGGLRAYVQEQQVHGRLDAAGLLGFVFMLVLVGASLAGFGSESVAAELRDADGAITIFGGGPALPLCNAPSHLACLQDLNGTTFAAAGASVACSCITARGWDAYTLGAIVADLSNAISSALVFKRLSAVAKYVCRAMSAVPMYLFYCGVGRFAWDFRVFSIVVFLCAQVTIYTVQRHRAAEEAASTSWANEYGGVSAKTK